MGKCELATASIGIKIRLSDLISQINETNFTVIKEILEDGWVEDENDYFNEAFSNIVFSDEVPEHATEFKEHMTHAFTHNGSYIKTRDGRVIPTVRYGCLLDQYLLFPVKNILTNERWGYDRSGTNGKSRSIDFDLSVDLEPYREIQHTQVVFLLGVHSG